MAGVLAAVGGWLASGNPGAVAKEKHAVSVRVVAPATLSAQPLGVSASPPAIPWPKTGEGAVDVPAVGYRAQSGAERPVPVASLTKIMTAYVILADHPLAVGRQGPRIHITPADAQNYGVDTVTDQSSVELQAGEVLTEHQMLEGLLVHSANDFAYALATWDAGSIGAFVAKMNAEAGTLGMHATHFVDASGYQTGSVSTAADLLRVASAAMTDPVFAQIVSMPSVTLPVAGTVTSYTPLITTPSVMGVKSGFTGAAGGCDILAYQAETGGKPFLVLAAVTSQQGPTVLLEAGHEALAIAQAAATRAGVATVAPAGTVVARLAGGRHVVDATTGSAAVLLASPGQRVREAVHVHAPALGARAGTMIGSVTFESGGQLVSVPVRTASALAAPKG